MLISNCPSTSVEKDYSFPLLNCLGPLVKNELTINGLFLDSQFYSINLYICFCSSDSTTISFLNFNYLFLAALGLRCCAWAFSSSGKLGLLFVVVRVLLIAVAFSCFGAQALGVWASVVVAHGLSSCGSQALEHRLSSCGSWA